RYALESVLGRGGAATVYAARDLLLQREVAVKLFAARADRPEHLLEQEAEARLVAQLNHPSLTTLLDAGVEIVDGGAPQLFLVMERVVGVDLRRRLRSGPLTPLQAAYVGYDLAEGLQFVHRHGYLHRDVKPANILLDERAAARIRGKLTDFGISSRLGTSQGEFTTGTAAYLGPEQVEGLGEKAPLGATSRCVLHSCVRAMSRRL
ncbi:MAG: serine/threonine protein kinase, partial [Terriglobus roseus]|nr:serine/threonine protein kinase [Terriglobus roseus]